MKEHPFGSSCLQRGPLGVPQNTKGTSVDGAATLFILAIAGVVAIFISSLKGVLDQVRDVLDSAGRARDAWERFKGKGGSPRDLPPSADEEEPPGAA